MEMRGAICIFIFIQLFPPLYLIPLSGPCLLLGAGCVLCQQSLMANFSKFSPNHLSSPNFYLLTTDSLSSWTPGGIGQLSSHSNKFKINILFIVICNGEIEKNADWLRHNSGLCQPSPPPSWVIVFSCFKWIFWAEFQARKPKSG